MMKRAPGGLIVFHADLRVVIGQDVTHDGQAQAGAAALGGKIGQEQLLLVVRR